MPPGRGLSVPSRIVLYVQVVAHSTALMFSLMVMVPMSVHQEHFRGHCILFSTGAWQERDGQFKVDWASQAYCNFAIFVSVVAFVASLASLLRTVSYLRKNADASLFGAFCQVLADATMAVFTLIAALFITLGFKVWWVLDAIKVSTRVSKAAAAAIKIKVGKIVPAATAAEAETATTKTIRVGKATVAIAAATTTIRNTNMRSSKSYNNKI